MNARIIALGILPALAWGVAAIGQQSVVDSPHNLSAAGTGDIHAVSEPQVCIFCHTPHRASAVRPLWNRTAPLTPYQVYQSSALDARIDQPTGASKMCLSCHDGSIALGSVLSRDQDIAMAGTVSTMPIGPSNLGTNLADDHPVSFVFDSALAAQDGRLADPHGLPPQVTLDGASELQCTACHDAHDNSLGDFLVLDNAESRLCNSCHTISETTIERHRNCSACHTTHSSPSGPFLLARATVDETCMRCHDGNEHDAPNLRTDMEKLSVHSGQLIPGDGIGAPDGETSCTDCHDPHTMEDGAHAEAPLMASNFGRQASVLGDRHSRAEASYEYEVCFRCHGEETRVRRSPVVSRLVTASSTRMQFDPSNPSYHPVMAAGRSEDVPSLRPGWSEGSLVLCSDCHGSDTSRKAGGAGPNGVHGSNYPPLLLGRYDTLDYTPESAAAYDLCYRCHERDGRGGILEDASFPHRVHVVDGRASCSTCHDAHGISSAQGNRINNSHLINFDTSIVFPDPVTGRIEFVDRGRFSGSCALTCHGVAHSPLDY